MFESPKTLGILICSFLVSNPTLSQTFDTDTEDYSVNKRQVQNPTIDVESYKKSPTNPKKTNPYEWKLAIGGGIVTSSNSKVDMDLFEYSTGAFIASGDFETKGMWGLHIEADVRRKLTDDWMVILGMNYEVSREIREYKVTYKIGNTSISETEDGDTDSEKQLALYANLAYTIGNVYIPFGISYTDMGGAKPGIGGQVGLGYYFTEKIVGEFFARVESLGVNGLISEDDDMQIKPGKDKGTSTTTRFTLKYIF